MGVRSVSDLWLELDGARACELEWAAGGDSVGMVAETPAGSGAKHISNVQVEDLVLETAVVVSPLMEWAQDMLAGRRRERSGSVVAGDGRQEVWRLDFADAMLAGLTLPECDASSTEPLRAGFTLRPGRTMIRQGGSSAAPLRPVRSRPATTFGLDIDRLGIGPHTSRVGPLVVTWDAPESAVGEFREPGLGVPRLHVGDLEIDASVAATHALVDWHRNAVVLGAGDDERTGTLSYVGADFRPVVTARLRGLGIRRVSGFPSLAASRTRISATFYCEAVDLSWAEADGTAAGEPASTPAGAPAAATVSAPAGRLELETTLRLPPDRDIQSLRGHC